MGAPDQSKQILPYKLEWCSRGQQEGVERPSQEGKAKELSSCPTEDWRGGEAGKVRLKTFMGWS